MMPVIMSATRWEKSAASSKASSAEDSASRHAAGTTSTVSVTVSTSVMVSVMTSGSGASAVATPDAPAPMANPATSVPTAMVGVIQRRRFGAAGVGVVGVELYGFI